MTIRLLIFSALYFLSTYYSTAQLTTSFRVVSVSSDIDDMDPAGTGANGLDSDPQWDYQITDVPFANNSAGVHNIQNLNCPGTIAITDTFFTQTYAIGCNTPTAYTFEWSGVDSDVPTVVPTPTGGAQASQIINIPALSLTYPSGGWLPLGTYNVTAAGTDCGATGTVTWTIEVEYLTIGVTESTLPTITCPTNVTQAVDVLSCTAVVNGIAPVAVTDNCGVGNQTWDLTGATVNNSPPVGMFDASGETFNAGVTTVTYTVQDYSGNAVSCSFTVTVVDNEAPFITCPINVTQNSTIGSCNGIVNGIAPVVADSCGVTLQTWSLTGATTANSAAAGINDASGQNFNPGVTTVNYYIEDAAGNSANCSFTVTIVDAEDPLISCPADITQANDAGSCGAIITYTAPIGTDNCPAPVTVMIAGQASGTLFPIGLTVVTYEVTDAAGNTAQCSFNVTVNDTENPAITCPVNITQNVDAGLCGAIVTYTAPVGTDNCPAPTTSMITGQISGTIFPVGTTTVTYEVTDASANTAQCSFDVTINDTENPVISCPADILVSNDAGLCGATVNYVAPIGTDNCPGAITTMTAGQASGTVFPIGLTVVTYQVVDAIGNTAQCSFNVTVNDSELPVINCPGNIIVANDAGLCGATVNYVAPVGSDNCAGAATLMIAGQASGTVFPIGVTVVTYEVTDASSNTAQCSFNVTVNDTENPAISCPVDITVSNDAGSCGGTVTYVAPVGTDNCPAVVTSMTAGLVSGSFFPTGTTLVTYEAVDASGNTVQCSFNITVNDTENPTITCPANITVSNDAGICGAIVNFAAPIGSDNCPAANTSLIAGQISGTIFPIGTTTITYEVTDASGNTAQCSFDVIVNDPELPTITCQADITQNNDAGLCGATVNFTAPVGTDNCAGSSTSLITILGPGAFFPIGSVVVTYEVVDLSGNSAQCSFDVIISDTENPTISCPADIIVSNDVGACGAIINYVAPTGSDNCTGSSTSMIAGQASATLFPIGLTVVTYEVTDASGNTAQCSFNVTVNDTENPTISCPADILIGNDAGICGAIVNFVAPIGNDNCPASSTSMIAGQVSGSLFPIGTTVITYEVTDAVGNTAQCSFNITINDTENPTITCPANITVNNDAGICGAIVNYAAPIGSDNCPASNTSLIAGQISGTIFPIGTTTITYEVTDASGNTAQCSFDVIVNDAELPTITCQADITQNNDAGLCGATVNFTAPVGTDNCAGSSTSLITILGPGAFFPIGSVVVTYEVVDLSGNSAQCSFDVIVSDTENPTISCPADITTSNDIGACGAIVNYVAPTGSDNCTGSSTSMIAGQAAGTLFPIGLTVVTYEVTDASGNTAQCSFNVTVNDTENPTINCPADILVGNDAGICGAIVNYAAPVGTDNCPGSTTSMIAGQVSASLFPIGITTITFETVDAAGNSSQCSFNITVNDTENPNITCPLNITQNTDPGLCGAIVTYTAPVGTDNCPAPTSTLISGQASGTVFPTGTTTVTYEVTDAAGNSTQCSFDVTINDIESPTITCPADINIANTVGTCGATVNYTAPVGTDNCPGGTTTLIAGQLSGTAFPIGLTVVTYEIVDAAGNTAQCSFNVTVFDTEPPVINCPADIITSNSAGTCGAVVIYTPPIGTDNCAGSSTTIIAGQGSGTLFSVGTTIVTYEVTDAAGNTTQCSFNITVNDTENPTITCPANITVNNDAGICGAIVNYAAPIGSDNCPAPITSIIAGQLSGTIFPTGTTTITYEVTDASGNTAQCSFDVIVNDTELPTIICQADITQNNDAGLCGATVNFTAPVGTDNCAGSSTSLITILGPGGFFPIGSVVVTYEVVDLSGNSAQCSFDVIVSDTENPTISCPADITTSNDIGTCGAIINYVAPTGTDNCTGSSTNMIAGLASGSLFPVGLTVVTYEVTDASGNTAQCSFNVTVNDTENPSISCPADILIGNDAGTCGAIVNYVAPVGNDNCLGATTSLLAGQVSGSFFAIGTTIITYEVTDAAGNTAQCSFNITVTDTENPTITCPINITQNTDPGLCGAIITYASPVEADNCPGFSTTLISGQTSGTIFPTGTTTVTYEVTDAAGNTAQCSFSVTVTDTELPTILCPADVNIANSVGICGATVNYTAPIGADNCPGSITSLIAGQASGTVFPIGLTVVTYEVADAAGNTAQCSFNVTVFDTELPIISCPLDITVSNDAGVCGATINYTAPVGTDNCPGAVTTMTAGLISGSLFPIGTSVITFDVTDAAGNSAQCSFNITVNDTENPVINCPADITVNNLVGVCGELITYIAPAGTDNCPTATTSMLSGQVSGTIFPVGITIVTYEVVDASSNSAQCSFNVTVIDNEAPVITCPVNITVNNDIGVCGANVTYTSPVISDNCPSPTLILITGNASGSLFPIGTTTNTFEVTDASGNTAQCSFDITVVDAELPTITCPADITVGNDIGSCDAVVAFANATINDNCPGGVITQIAGPISGSAFPVGTTIVTFEATDNAGNTAQCSFNITVNDTENPTITCPANSTANNDPGTCGATVVYTAPVGIDNCPGSITTLLSGLPSGSLFPGGVNTIIYEVTDGAGNVNQCSFDITIIDTEPPTISCPANITANNDLGVCGAIVNYSAPVITDNCPGYTVNILSGFATGALFPIGTTTVLIEVVDISGNTAQCSFDVTVIDNEAPLISCPADQTVAANANCEFILLDYISSVTGSDNCGSVTYSQAPASGTTITAGTLVTITATDSYGNIDSCTFNVLAVDNIAPILTCPSSHTEYLSALCDYTVTDFSSLLTIVENCNTYTYTQTPAVGTVLTADSLIQITVVDLAGNSSSCSFNMAVIDTTPPIVTCPVNLEVFFSSICDFAVQDYAAAISTFDNCGLASLTQSPLPGVLITGNTPITFTAVDIWGNTNQCTFTVIPKDTVPPVLSCPGDQIAYRDTACNAVVADFTSLAVIAATCETIPITQSPTPGTVINTNITVSLFGTDVSGNVNFCSFNLILLDTISPVISCSPDIFSCDSVVNYTPPLASDNCGVFTLVRTVGPPPLSIFPIGATLIAYEVTDPSGNIDTCSFYINVLPNPVLTVAVTDISCFGSIDGAIDATVSSGSAPFLFQWSNGSTSEDLINLPENTYTLVVTDKFGCSDTITDSIVEPPILETDYDISTMGCFGDVDGYIYLTGIQGGTNPYNFIWSPAVGTGTNATDLVPGTYNVSIVDVNGCSKDTTIIIAVSDSIVIDAEISLYDDSFNISEENAADGWIQLDISGGTAPYTYNWDTGQNDGYISGLIEGYYAVTVIDDNGCEQEAVYQLLAPIDINITNGLSPNGDGLNDIFFIENIEQFPNSHLLVMNRWGDIVYEMHNYLNDWDGTPNKGLILYGKRVPEGSYYYTLDLGDSLYENLSGYLIINGY